MRWLQDQFFLVNSLLPGARDVVESAKKDCKRAQAKQAEAEKDMEEALNRAAEATEEVVLREKTVKRACELAGRMDEMRKFIAKEIDRRRRHGPAGDQW